jgi:hypothetical protein
LTDSDTTSDDSPEIEIIEQDIIDLTIQVGSNCEWIGTGSEPQWDNPKSTKAYDHVERHHGPKLKPLRFRGRAASKNQAQGQWLDARNWVKAEQVTPKYPGRYIIDFKRPIGRVYHPDGTVTENVTRAFIRRNLDGTLRAGYPVLNNSTLSSLTKINDDD